MSSYTEKTSERLGRRLDAAATVRPQGGAVATGVAAGIGAGVGSVLGGPILAGVGGGLGAVAGMLVAAYVARQASPKLAFQMVLALDEQGFVLYGVSPIKGYPEREVLKAPYNEVARVTADEKILAIRAEIELHNGTRLKLEAVKLGARSGREALALLEERSSDDEK